MERLILLFNTYKKQTILFLITLLVILLGCGSFFIINHKYNKETKKPIEVIAQIDEKELENKEDLEDKKTIKIDIKGYVSSPGVYELVKGSRVVDAINIAGGLIEGAYTRYINLSKILEDETVLIINSDKEIASIKKGGNYEVNCENTNAYCLYSKNIVTNSYINNNDKNSSGSSNDNENDKLNTIVNINKSNKEELMKLDGIGESKAEKIIEYRSTNGDFKTIEEIKNVSGIGDSIYEKIKNNITI